MPDARAKLSMGDRGDEVRRLQQSLLQLGYSLPQYGVDGIYGSETASAVRQWKEDTSTELFDPIVDGSYVSVQGYQSLMSATGVGGGTRPGGDDDPPTTTPAPAPPRQAGGVSLQNAAIGVGVAAGAYFLLTKLSS